MTDGLEGAAPAGAPTGRLQPTSDQHADHRKLADSGSRAARGRAVLGYGGVHRQPDVTSDRPRGRAPVAPRPALTGAAADTVALEVYGRATDQPHATHRRHRATAEPPGDTPSSHLPHEPALDGLRGVAVALVLAFHAGFTGLAGGFLGVSAFFTLSGFLITRLLLVEHDRYGRIDLLAFWGRRFRRLLPASLLCLAGVLLFAATVATTGQRHALPGDVLAAVLDVENWHFILGGVGYATVVAAPSPLQHFWSLAIEEQFYLLFPPVMVLLLGRRAALTRRDRRRQRSRLLHALGAGIVVSVALGVWLFRPGGSPLRAYYGTGVRASELLVGCLLAVVLHRRAPFRRQGPRWALAAASLVSLAVLTWLWSTQHVGSALLYRGGLVLHAALVGVLIVSAIQPASPVKTIFGVRPLAVLGRISYGVYLFHWPIFLWLDPSRASAPTWVVQATRVALTLAVAALSYHLLELPIRHRRAGTNRSLAFALPAAAAALCLGAAGLAFNAAPARGNAVEVGLRESVSNAPVHVDAAHGTPPSPLGRPVRVATAGDSLAYQISYVFSPWTTVLRDRIDIVDTTAVPGCGLIERGELTERDAAISGQNLERLRKDGDASGPCRTVTERNAKLLQRARPDVVIAISGVWDTADHRFPGDHKFRGPGDPVYDQELLSEYQQRIDQWRSGGAAVVWAEWPCIAPAPMADGGTMPTGFDPGRMRYLKDNILVRLARANPDVRFVDLSRGLCPGGAFRAQDQSGHRLRMDDGMHITADGAALARDQLVPEVMAAAATVAHRPPTQISATSTAPGAAPP